MRHFLAILLLLGAFTARAQDVLTIGTGAAPSGGTASVPISIRDIGGTPLGSDAGTGNRIQAFGFKVLFSTSYVQSVSFARAGVTASLTPLYESGFQDEGVIAYVVSFSELTNVIPFTLNATAPGDVIGTLMVTLRPTAPVGHTVPLKIEPAGAILSNQSSSVSETVASGNLTLVNGSIQVILGAPTGVVATAIGVTQVDVSWNAAVNADHYEVWRSVDGAAYAFIGSTSGLSLSEITVTSGKTYLYKVRTVDAMGAMSAFSNVDAATTMTFTDDPIVALTTRAKAVHFTEVRTAINAFRRSASLTELPADPTVAVGLAILASHLTTLRTALDEARTAAGVSPLAYTNPTITPDVTRLRAIHVQELRNGVK